MTTQHFAYDDQLAAIPAVVSELVDRAGYPALAPDRPIVFSGIGTSLHAARIAASWVAQLTGGERRATAVDAHDLGAGAYPITARDQVVVISHRGYKTYPTAALHRARELGCPTIAIVGNEAPQQQADFTIRTCANETAGTFSVSYLASLAVLAKVLEATFPVATQEFGMALGGLPDVLAKTLARQSRAAAERMEARSPILISGFGPDYITAQEGALKIKEGAWLWTEAMSPEFALHGTPASFHAEMGAVVLLPAEDDGGRTEQLVGVLRQLGIRVLTCADNDTADLTFASPPHPLLRPFVSILPLHLLTGDLARLRGTDPDTLHGNREPWRTVMTGLTL